MSDMSRQALALLSLLSAMAPLLGGTILTIYSIENGFFPYFLSVVPIAMLVFISVVSGFVFLIALGMGAMATLSAFMILTVLEKSLYFRSNGIMVWPAFRRAVRGLRSGTSHMLLPSSRSGLSGAFFLSLLLLVWSLSVIVLFLRSTSVNTHGFGFLLFYFIVAGFFTVALVDSATGWTELVNKRIPLLALMLVTTLPTFWAGTPLLDTLMNVMDFRSMQSQAVLVDDAAEEQIAQQAMFISNGIKRCAVSLTGGSMWYVPQGVVVWKGVGDKMLVSLSVENAPPLQLDPDQVLLVRRSSALPC